MLSKRQLASPHLPLWGYWEERTEHTAGVPYKLTRGGHYLLKQLEKFTQSILHEFLKHAQKATAALSDLNLGLEEALPRLPTSYSAARNSQAGRGK